MKDINMDRSNPDHEERLPAFLGNRRKDNPFVVPHNYFSELPDKMLQRIKEERPTSLFEVLRDGFGVWTHHGILRPVLTLASLLLIMSIIWLWPKPEGQVGLTELTWEEVTDYVISNIDEFEEEFFYLEEANELELLGESLNEDDVEILLNDLIDDLDAETLQNIL